MILILYCSEDYPLTSTVLIINQIIKLILNVFLKHIILPFQYRSLKKPIFYNGLGHTPMNTHFALQQKAYFKAVHWQGFNVQNNVKFTL